MIIINGRRVEWRGKRIYIDRKRYCWSWNFEQANPDDPEAALAEMVEDYRRGMRLDKITQKYKLTRTGIRLNLLKMGIVLRGRGGQQASHRRLYAQPDWRHARVE